MDTLFKVAHIRRIKAEFFIVRDYKRCLSIFGRLGRLNAKACVVFGDFIVKDRTRQDAIV